MTELKIVVLSDSHRCIQYMLDAIETERPNYVIHLGDHHDDTDELRRHYPMLPILSVKGNCDFDPNCRELAIAEYDGVRIMAAHGHKYGVKSGLLRFVYAAKENQVQVALFGHTHSAYCEQYDGIWVLNPGSCGCCSCPSYGLIEIQSQNAICQIRRIQARR